MALARLGPGPCPSQHLLSEVSEPSSPPSRRHLSPGSPSSGSASKHAQIVPVEKLHYVSKCGSPGATIPSPHLSPGHVEQTDPSPAPVRSRPRPPSSSASPARSRRHSRSLTGCHPSHVTERQAPPSIILLPAPRHALFAGSFFSGKAGFPSLFMLKSSRTPLIFTVNQFPKYFHLHWWFL